MSDQVGKNAKSGFAPRSREQKLESELSKCKRQLGEIPAKPNNWKLEEFPKSMGPMFPVIFGDATHGANGIVEERVVHRPFGKTFRYDEKDWAISKLGDVRTFFEKRDNPDFSKIQKVINALEDKLLVSKGLVVMSPTGQALYATSKLERREEINKAREYHRIHKSVNGAQAMNLWICYMDARAQEAERSCLAVLAEMYKNEQVVKYLYNQYEYEPKLLDKTKQVIIDKYRGLEPEQIMSRIYDSICCPDQVIKIEREPPKFAAQLVVLELPKYFGRYQLVTIKGHLDDYEKALKAYNKAKADPKAKEKSSELEELRGNKDKIADEIKEFDHMEIPMARFEYFYPFMKKEKSTTQLHPSLAKQED
jgi:tetratricopeptide (TPR) repeat protein